MLNELQFLSWTDWIGIDSTITLIRCSTYGWSSPTPLVHPVISLHADWSLCAQTVAPLAGQTYSAASCWGCRCVRGDGAGRARAGAEVARTHRASGACTNEAYHPVVPFPARSGSVRGKSGQQTVKGAQTIVTVPRIQEKKVLRTQSHNIQTQPQQWVLSQSILNILQWQ